MRKEILMIYFKKDRTLHKVREDEIVYIHQDKRDVVFVTEKGEFCLKSNKISDVEDALGEEFFKCHSYMLVNLNKVDKVGPMEVMLNGDFSVGMCKAATDKLKRELRKRNPF